MMPLKSINHRYKSWREAKLPASNQEGRITMSKPIAFGAYVYKHLKDCTIECRKRIYQYSAGDTLTVSDQDYFQQLFTLHPNYKKKRGVGIKSIMLDSDGLGNNCLWIVREDNSKEHISWRKCVRPHTEEEIIEMAFKRAVTGDITKVGVKDKAITYNANDNFKKLLKRFLNNNKTNYKQITLKHPVDNSDPRPLLADNWLAAEWYIYHEENQLMLA